jgi:hypothetical protein
MFLVILGRVSIIVQQDATIYSLFNKNLMFLVILGRVSIIVQQDATIYSLFISVNCSTCFGRYLHPSSGAHVTVSTASGISKAVTATFRKHDWTGTQHTVLPTRLLIPMHVKHTIPYHNCIYSRLPDDEPSGSKHVEDIKN